MTIRYILLNIVLDGGLCSWSALLVCSVSNLKDKIPQLPTMLSNYMSNYHSLLLYLKSLFCSTIFCHYFFYVVLLVLIELRFSTFNIKIPIYLFWCNEQFVRWNDLNMVNDHSPCLMTSMTSLVSYTHNCHMQMDFGFFLSIDIVL